VTDISAAHHSDHSLAAIKCPGHLSYWTAASARTHAGNGTKFDTLENQQLHCTEVTVTAELNNAAQIVLQVPR